MKPITLVDFVDFLDQQTDKSFRGDTVDKFLTEHKVNSDDFAPFMFFREETYGRNLIFRGEHYELLVLTWLPEQRTPIHNHAGSRCWMLVQTGKLAFRTFKAPNLNKVELVCKGPVETIAAGSQVYIDDGIGVHCIANASTKPAVSVHLYAAPIEQCQIYNEANKKFEWTQLEYFTHPNL